MLDVCKQITSICSLMIFKSEHELLTLREVGHAPYWEAPGEFNHAVLDFLRRNFARGTAS